MSFIQLCMQLFKTGKEGIRIYNTTAPFENMNAYNARPVNIHYI